MKTFTETILGNFPQFGSIDFIYFTDEVENKVKALSLPNKACGITFMYKNSRFAEYYQREYCLLNCGLKCISE